MARAKVQKVIKDLTFEKALHELQDVVQKLEEGELALEETIALYERGQALVSHCGLLLDRAELRLKALTPNADGEPQEVELEGGPEADEP